jgi:hypothetical protein
VCEKCDRTVELIKQTQDDRNAWVELSFPNGEAKLVRREEKQEVNAQDD